MHIPGLGTIANGVSAFFGGLWGSTKGSQTHETHNQPKAEVNHANTTAPSMTQTQTTHIYNSPPPSAGDEAGASSSGMEKTAATTNNFINNHASGPTPTPSWRDDFTVCAKAAGIGYAMIKSYETIIRLKDRSDASNDAMLLAYLDFPHCGNLRSLPEKAPGRLWGMHDCVEKRKTETENAVHRLRKHNFPGIKEIDEERKRCFVREEWRKI